MCKEDILKKVIGLFSTMSDAEQITPGSELIDDLGISSMDVLFLISSMEEEFKIQIPESAIRKMVTVDDVAEVIASLMK